MLAEIVARTVRRRRVAETRLDLEVIARRALERWRAAPELPDEVTLPPTPHASLLCGEAGILLVAWRLTGEPSLADDLLARVRENVDNPTDEVMWGAPGTMVAARAMHAWTGELRWAEAWAESARALLARRDANAVLARSAVWEDGLANWTANADRATLPGRDGEIRLQWCAGAPGLVTAAAPHLADELLLAGAELTWRAGAHGAEKGAGICHGTAGNGYALLRTFERTGDERWLDRARAFAMHALAQADGRHALFTGDLGAALFAADCLAPRARFPVLGGPD